APLAIVTAFGAHVALVTGPSLDPGIVVETARAEGGAGVPPSGVAALRTREGRARRDQPRRERQGAEGPCRISSGPPASRRGLRGRSDGSVQMRIACLRAVHAPPSATVRRTCTCARSFFGRWCPAPQDRSTAFGRDAAS